MCHFFMDSHICGCQFIWVDSLKLRQVGKASTSPFRMRECNFVLRWRKRCIDSWNPVDQCARINVCIDWAGGIQNALASDIELATELLVACAYWPCMNVVPCFVNVACTHWRIVSWFFYTVKAASCSQNMTQDVRIAGDDLCGWRVVAAAVMVSMKIHRNRTVARTGLTHNSRIC